MARQAVPVEHVEAYVSDLQQTVDELKSVAQDMRKHDVAAIVVHAIKAEGTYIPKLFDFALDCRKQFRIALNATSKGIPDPTLRTVERAQKEMERRKAKQTPPPKKGDDKPPRGNGKPK